MPLLAHDFQDTERHPGAPQTCAEIGAQAGALAEFAVEVPARLRGRIAQIDDLLLAGAARRALARQPSLERLGVDEPLRRGAAQLTALLQQPHPRVRRPQ